MLLVTPVLENGQLKEHQTERTDPETTHMITNRVVFWSLEPCSDTEHEVLKYLLDRWTATLFKLSLVFSSMPLTCIIFTTGRP